MGKYDDMSNCVIIDNLPKVDSSKYEKLKGVVEKVVNKLEKVTAKTFELCRTEDGSTAGFAFVEYESGAAADRAVQKLDKMRLDKQHVFKVCLFTDYIRYKDTPDELAEDDNEADAPTSDLGSWLLDEHAREQFFTRSGEDIEIVWHDQSILAKTVSEYKKPGWTDLHARWSPLGTYLATFHTQGIRLWGGREWNNLAKFAHSNVQMLDFSPKEKFVVTWYNNMSIWDLKTSKKLRAFPGGPTPDQPWPIFKWSANEEYMIRKSEDNLNIYDTSTMKLIQPDESKNTSMYIPQVSHVEWSPSGTVFAFWVQSRNHQPPRVELVQVEKKVKKDNKVEVVFNTIARKQLFNVVDFHLRWHGTGDYLCVKVDRYAKTSTAKEKVTTFELFRLRSTKSSEIAVETVSFNETVLAFAWEPKGVRFAVIHGRPGQGVQISFYTMGPAKAGTVKKLHSVERKSASHLFWSPRGTHVIIADVTQPTGALEFYNVNDQETMNTCEHYLCTDVEWDASGRYVTTSVSAFRYQSDTGYIIWSFQGVQLFQASREKFFQFGWRPRPASLLADNRVRTIAKNLSVRSKNYEDEQRKLEQREKAALAKERRDKMAEFAKGQVERRAASRQNTEIRRKSRTCDWHSDSEDIYELVEVTEEQIVSVEEEEMPE